MDRALRVAGTILACRAALCLLAPARLAGMAGLTWDPAAALLAANLGVACAALAVFSFASARRPSTWKLALWLDLAVFIGSAASPWLLGLRGFGWHILFGLDASMAVGLVAVALATFWLK